MKKCGFTKTCKKLCAGDSGDDNNVCPQTVPLDCEDCISLGDECIKNNGMKATCKGFGYKKGQCPVELVCSQVRVFTYLK